MKTAFRFFILISVLLATGAGATVAAQDEPNALDFIPPSRFVSGWTASGNEWLSDLQNAAYIIGDDVYLLDEFDLVWYATETYTQGADEMEIEIFEFNSGSDAFGYYNLSYIEPPDPEEIEVTPPYGPPPMAIIDTMRSVTYDGEEFIEGYKGKFYFRIKTAEEYLMQSGKQAGLWIYTRLPGQPIPADMIGQLPVDSRVMGTERYIKGPEGLARIMPTHGYDLFGMNGLDWKAATAEYRLGSGEYYLFVVVEYEDTDGADDAFGMLTDYYTDGGWEPVMTPPLESGINTRGFRDNIHIAFWTENNTLKMIWDATSSRTLLQALEQH